MNLVWSYIMFVIFLCSCDNSRPLNYSWKYIYWISHVINLLTLQYCSPRKNNNNKNKKLKYIVHILNAHILLMSFTFFYKTHLFLHFMIRIMILHLKEKIMFSWTSWNRELWKYGKAIRRINFWTLKCQYLA
jgi:hypothetical protein